MKSTRVKKLKREDLPELPAWWKRNVERAQNSPLARMTEEDIGQLCEDLADEATRERAAQKAS